MTETIALSLGNVSKTFPGTKALDAVSIEVRRGEVHALMGQNGSGKSTLIKILAGFHQPDRGGAATILGRDFALGSRHAAHAAGLRFVHQDLGLVGALDTVDNLAIGFGYTTGFGNRIKWRAQHQRSRSAVEALGHDIDLRVPVERLPVSDRTAVAIARALQGWDNESDIPLLVLDEPTAAMPLPEIDRFLKIVRRVADRGTAVLYVSHHLGEVLDLADRMTVLRDGVAVDTIEVAAATEEHVVQLMTGKTLQQGATRAAEAATTGIIVRVRALRGGALTKLDLEIAPGEVVGIAGISGSGRDEVCDLIFGSRERRGDVELKGELLPPADPGASVSRGIALVPANRHRDGVILPFSVRENLTLPDLSPFWRWLVLGRRAEQREAKNWIKRLGVKTPSTETPVESLSGGNQQKVVIGKWLRVRPDLLLLDEPTQGVDVVATVEIHELISEVIAEGTAVLVCSSDEEELARLCSRVLVLRSGEVGAVLTGEQVTAAAIIAESLSIVREQDDDLVAAPTRGVGIAEGGPS